MERGEQNLSLDSLERIAKGLGITAAALLAEAFVEGFADFFGAWVAGDSLRTGGFSDFNFETNSYRTIGDGSLIEGAVAAFFYDLVDGTTERDNDTNTGKITESWDTLVYPAAYVAQLMESCQLKLSSIVWQTRLDGIDGFIHCAERTLSAQSLPQYFPTRTANYLAFTEGATEPPTWSPSAIRSLWRYDLYDDAP